MPDQSNPLFYMTKRDDSYFAEAEFDGRGMTVHKGSRIRLNVMQSGGNDRKKHMELVDSNGYLIQDIYFGSPSTAASFVCGRSANGWVEWKTEDGVKLDAFRRPGAPAAPQPVRTKTVHNAAESAVRPTDTDRPPVPVLPQESGARENTAGAGMPTPAVQTDSNRRLEKKLDTLLSAIHAIGADNQAAPEPPAAAEKTDKRFRIRPTDGRTVALMLRDKALITGLVLRLRLAAFGFENDSERFRLFFVDEAAEQLSEILDLKAVSGEEYSCKFSLKSAASEKEVLYLVVQTADAQPDEACQLFRFRVKIVFAADFGI